MLAKILNRANSPSDLSEGSLEACSNQRPANRSQRSRYLVGRRRNFLCGVLLFAAGSPLYASNRLKTDIVYMKNGDKITCEIRSLEQGQLTVKQHYANSTVVLDWSQVDRIQSSQPFVVVDTKGDSYSGSLSEAIGKHTIMIEGVEEKSIPHEDVVSIQETGKTFVRRLRGDFDLGLSFAQSNAQKNLTLQVDLTYQAKSDIAELTSSSQFSSQKETSDTNETTVKTEYFRQLRRSNWYGGVIANFLSSTEQQIALQTTLGGAVAVRPIYTNKTNLSIIGGLGATFQRDASDTTSTASKYSIDAAAAAQFSTFRFDSVTFETTLWVYPSLTTTGRIRMTLNQDIYYKFYKDFYIRGSFYDNYDNRPVVGAPSNNLGITSTVGWSFR